MGTDRRSEFSGPCACGKGSFEIDYCTPDHGWSVSTPEWYEASISCPTCRATYELQQFGKAFHLVSKVELATIEDKLKKVYAAEKNLHGMADAKGLIQALTNLLDNQSSLAATHRLLSSAGLEHKSLATFRKRWRGSTAWVETQISGYSVKRVLKLTGVQDAELQSGATQLDQLSTESNLPPTPIEPPVYVLAD